MRLFIFFLLSLLGHLSVLSQTKIIKGIKEISKTEYESCVNNEIIIHKLKISKKDHKLIIPIVDKKAKVFSDDSSDENFCEFEYIGEVLETQLSLIKKMTYNDEEFYFIDRRLGSIDTLIGSPLFYWNRSDFVCINNPGTDEKQRIQICTIKNGVVTQRGIYEFDGLLKEVSCIEHALIYVKDNHDKYWKLTLRI